MGIGIQNCRRHDTFKGIQDKISNHSLRCNVCASRKRILDSRPNSTNTLNRQSPPCRSRDSKPKHSENTSRYNTKVRQVHPKTPSHKNRERNVQARSRGSLQCDRNRNQHEPESNSAERLLPVQSTGKECRRHLPDRYNKRVAEPVCNIIVCPPSPVPRQNRIQVSPSTSRSERESTFITPVATRRKRTRLMIHLETKIPEWIEPTPAMSRGVHHPRRVLRRRHSLIQILFIRH